MIKSAAEHTADAERIARLFRTLYELPKPTIAVVHGRGDCRRDGAGDDLRLYAGGAGGEVWVYGGADRVCAGGGVGVSGVADWGEAGAGSAADGAAVYERGGVAAGAGE